MSAIDWRHDGRRIVLPVALLGPGFGSDLRFKEGVALVDTGATVSGIAPAFVRDLGLEEQGKRPIRSVHGEQQAQRYLFRIGLFPTGADGTRSVLPYVFEDVSGFELGEQSSFAALIGMDVLSQCDFSIDRRGQCRIAFGSS